MNDEVEYVVLDLMHAYRKKYKETKDKHFKYLADNLETAYKELKQYHKIRRQLFPDFKRGET